MAGVDHPGPRRLLPGPHGSGGVGDPEFEVRLQVTVLNELHRACSMSRFPKGVAEWPLLWGAY